MSDDALYEDDVNDDDLYKAVYDRRWDYSRMLLKRTDALRLIRYEDPELGRGVLLAASCRNAPLDIVQSIIHLDPSQLTQQDEDGCTPLHDACCSASEEVVMLMLSVAPHAAAISDNCGDLPLHWAIGGRLVSIIIRRLLLIHPTAVYKEDWNNQTPLSIFIDDWNWGAQHTIPMETFMLLIQAHAHGTLDERTATPTREWRPLHEAFKIKGINISSNFIRVLVDTMHIKPDEDRNFSLHLACAVFGLT